MKHKLVVTACVSLLAGCQPFSSTVPMPEPTAVPAITPDTVQVMVLGTYHFGNPGQDLHNVEADNVLAPERQRQLKIVADTLAEFAPTVVAVERQPGSADFVDPGYAQFQTADLATQPNEIQQIGYRLARQLGLRVVYGIDEQPVDVEPDYFPFDAVAAHVESTDQKPLLDALIAQSGTMVQAFSEKQKTESVAGLLIETNSLPMSGADFYYQLLKFDEGERQPGADLNAYWFMRNAKIFSKLADVVNPGDRVVIVYGAGHKHWLEHLVEQTPGFALIDPIPFLRKAQALSR